MASKLNVMMTVLLIGMTSTIMAEGLDFDPNCQGVSTDRQTLQKEMCGCTNNYLTQINKNNPPSTSLELEKYSKIEAKVSVINGVRKLVDQYRQDLLKLAHPDNKALLPEKLLSYKKAINDAIVLNSINSFVTKTPELITEKDFDLKKMCLKNGNEENYKFICEYHKNDDHWYAKSYVDTMKRFIDAYKIAANNGDKKLLDEKIQTILKDIPKESAPEFVSRLEKTFSPELKDSMEKVTKDFEDQCSNKINCEPNYLKFSNNVNEKLVAELNSYSQQIGLKTPTMQDKNFVISNQIQDFVRNNLQDKFKAFESTRNKEISESFKAYTKPRENFGRFAFKNLGEKIKEQNGGDDRNFSETSNRFLNECVANDQSDYSKLSDYDKIVRMNDCNNLIQKMYDTFSDEEIKNANNELAQAHDNFIKNMNSPETRSIHILENFIATNYIRNCSNKKDQVDTVQGCPNDVLSPISNFKLDGKVYNIIGKINPYSNADSVFTTAELNDVKTFCRNNYSTYRLACKNVEDLYKNAIGKKTNTDWEKLHQDYWVKSNENDGSISLVQKKSLGRMFGEALVPAIANNIPYALYNYAASSNIEMMQQQAMLQKQWMWDMDQANTFWLNNYFNTGTSSALNFTSTNSFNFAN